MPSNRRVPSPAEQSNDRPPTTANAAVTCVVTCHDSGRHVVEAVESLVGQTGGSPRIIVVDDASTDEVTLEALGCIAESVRVIRNERNEGVCVSRNRGMEQVDTPYALVLDGDDRLTSNALAEMRPMLESDPSIGFVYGRIRMFGEMSGVISFPPFDPYGLLFRHTVSVSALMRTALWRDVGGFDADFEELDEGWEFWVNAVAHGWRGRRIDPVTLEYRKHGASMLTGVRAAYGRTWAALRRKHEAVYRNLAPIVAESRMGGARRACYRYLWGPRPWPAWLENALYSLVWRPGRKRSG